MLLYIFWFTVFVHMLYLDIPTIIHMTAKSEFTWLSISVRNGFLMLKKKNYLRNMTTAVRSVGGVLLCLSNLSWKWAPCNHSSTQNCMLLRLCSRFSNCKDTWWHAWWGMCVWAKWKLTIQTGFFSYLIFLTNRCDTVSLSSILNQERLACMFTLDLNVHPKVRWAALFWGSCNFPRSFFKALDHIIRQ